MSIPSQFNPMGLMEGVTLVNSVQFDKMWSINNLPFTSNDLNDVEVTGSFFPLNDGILYQEVFSFLHDVCALTRMGGSITDYYCDFGQPRHLINFNLQNMPRWISFYFSREKIVLDGIEGRCPNQFPVPYQKDINLRFAASYVYRSLEIKIKGQRVMNLIPIEHFKSPAFLDKVSGKIYKPK